MRAVLLITALVVAVAAGYAATAQASSHRGDLRITVWPQGQPGQSRAWTLRCLPTNGTHPQRARACQTLSRLSPQPFRPVPRDAMCTMVYGGPQEALVTGTFQGRRVWARFNLRNGCQIARWNRLAPLLPAANATNNS